MKIGVVADDFISAGNSNLHPTHAVAHSVMPDINPDHVISPLTPTTITQPGAVRLGVRIAGRSGHERGQTDAGRAAIQLRLISLRQAT